MDNAVGDALFCVAYNLEIEAVVQVLLMKLQLRLNETCDCGVFVSRCWEVMRLVPPLDCCEEISTQLFGRRKESASARVM